jgi:hypothetical protein
METMKKQEQEQDEEDTSATASSWTTGTTPTRPPRKKTKKKSRNRGAIHQLLNIVLKLRILVLLLVSTLPYVVKVKNYS